MITTRRHLLLGAAATVLLARLAPGVAFAQASDPSGFVASFGRELVGIVNAPTSDSQKASQLAAAIERDVDIDAIARFCLGRYVRTATPAQLADYTQAFHHVLIHSIVGHLGEYRGVTFTVGRTVPNPEGQAVESVVTRPGQAPANVQWVVETNRGAPKVVDVLAEGTSLRLTQRSDYAGYLSHNGGDVSSLIAAMKRQASAG